MAIGTELAAKGRITEVRENLVVFCPNNTNYQLHLISEEGHYADPTNEPVEVVIKGIARKMWTVVSGGNFISPIFGPPRIVQGRVRYADEKVLVVQAGAPLTLELPASDMAIDLTNGPITVGSLVNATILPGATFHLAEKSVAR
jgi:hypothetical protein